MLVAEHFNHRTSVLLYCHITDMCQSALCACPVIAICLAAAAAGSSGQPLPSKYDLIANVVHEGKAGQQTGGAPYKAHIQRSVEKTWYEVQVRPGVRYFQPVFVSSRCLDV
jgi:hypothetical protein